MEPSLATAPATTPPAFVQPAAVAPTGASAPNRNPGPAATPAIAARDEGDWIAIPVPPALPISDPKAHYRVAFTRGTMLFTYGPGTFSDFGGSRNPIDGLWAGGGLTIANVYGVWPYLPSARVYGTLGYSARYFAVGINLGVAAGNSPFHLFASFDAGPSLRLGSFTGAHVTLQLYWWLLPSAFPFPVGGELALFVPTQPRVWLQILLRGDARLGPWGGGTIGFSHRVGDGPKGHTYVSYGLGGTYSIPLPGALLEVGYTYRH